MFQTLQGHHQGGIHEGISTANSVNEVCVRVCVKYFSIQPVPSNTGKSVDGGSVLTKWSSAMKKEPGTLHHTHTPNHAGFWQDATWCIIQQVSMHHSMLGFFLHSLTEQFLVLVPGNNCTWVHWNIFRCYSQQSATLLLPPPWGIDFWNHDFLAALQVFIFLA